MTTEKLYRLMDILDDLKKIDSIILLHRSKTTDTSDMMLSQYMVRRNQLLVYFINELNATSDVDDTPQRLGLIKNIMERFYSVPGVFEKHDSQLDSLAEALSA